MKEERAREWADKCTLGVGQYAAGRDGYLAGFDAAIELASMVLDDWEMGTLEMVNSGDASMIEMRSELKKLQGIKRDILKLKGGA